MKPTSSERSQLRPGIRRHGAGWEVRAKHRGEAVYQSFAIDTPVKEMLDWRRDEVARMRLQHPDVPAGTFAADVDRYLSLESVKRMPTFNERKQHLTEWVTLFGDQRRRKITPLAIEAERDRLLTEPRGTDVDGEPLEPYSASAVNHRLRALSNVWTKLDGRRAYNPVAEVAEAEEPDAQARALPYDVIEAILDAIPDTYTGKRKDGTYTKGKCLPRPSKTKARLRVIAYTGLTHRQLALLTPNDVNFHAGTMRLAARRKGRKVRRALDRPLPQLLPLVPQAVVAFREFDRLKCWGPFSNSSMWKAFQRACTKLEIVGVRPYDLRHSWGTLVFEQTRDLRTTGGLLSHRSERTTRRYTVSTVAPHVGAAVELVRAKLEADTPPVATHAATRRARAR